MKKTALIAICIFCLVNLVWGETDIQKIINLAESGDAKAQYELGVMYDIGSGVPQNSAEAMKWFRKAADQGDIMAQFNVGVHYSWGRGVPQNNAEAMKWCRKAADQGFSNAQTFLGESYANGEGVPQNFIKAYVWFSLASANGNKMAKRNLETLSPKMTQQQIA